MSKAKEGDRVKIHYIGKLQNGEEFISTYDEESLTIQIGKGEVWENIEKELVGMAPGDIKTVKIKKEDGIPYSDELIFDLPKDAIPEDLNPQVGSVLKLQDPEGQLLLVKVLELKDEGIKIDSNHPLAGQDLEFTFELMEIVNQ